MASTAGTVTVSMPKLISTLTLRVRFARIAGARLWLSAQVMKLVGVIAGCDIEIEVKKDDGPPPARPTR